MKLKLAAAIFALVAIPALAFAQQGGSPPKVPRPTKADVQKVAQIISSDKAKLQSYCDSKKLYDQMGAAYKKNDSKTADALNKQAEALVSKLGPEYSTMMDGLEQVDRNSVKPRNLCPYFQGLINSVLALHWPNPFNPRALRLPNLHPPDLRPFNLRRGDPAPKSERHAHRLVLFPTVPIWALGS